MISIFFKNITKFIKLMSTAGYLEHIAYCVNSKSTNKLHDCSMVQLKEEVI
jgi:hypothetical protein